MVDPCSLSNTDEFVCKHLNWKVLVDFVSRKLSCSAKLNFECLKDSVKTLVLDSRDLSVNDVLLEDAKQHLNFKVKSSVKPFGAPLEIEIPEQLSKRGTVFTICIEYETSPNASALDWLEPSQTAGKKHPYLFTQCQAIHARSILPCQDTPSIKFTYDAEVTVPSELVALMSAVKLNEGTEGNKRKCHFEQKVPIPSYLLALVVGALEFRDVGPRSKVWSEKEMIEKAAYEFAEIDKMLLTAESLMGPYVWGRYDLIVLPPSFPYGGMENPCLTFVTPTLLAGDRSLTGVAAHEITHSWTGNLVTNRTWEHFWLNEGFTRFLEAKIISALEGEEMRQLQGIGSWKYLQDSIDTFGANNPLTALVPKLQGVDPDDSFSSVPYEKGFAFLYYIEHLVGGQELFNKFLKNYIENFKYKTIITSDFKEYLYSYFHDKVEAGVFDAIDWETWLHKPGMPPVRVVDMFDTSLVDVCIKLTERWLKASSDDLTEFSKEDLKEFSSRQIIEFLSQLLTKEPLPLSHIQAMQKAYNLNSYGNSEIRFRWLRLCVRVGWEDSFPLVVEFLLEQGRMKFVRPLYREMYKSEKSKELAIKTFKDNRQIYHKIASAMIEKDLHITD